MAQMKDEAQFEEAQEQAKSTEWGYLNVRDFQVRGWALDENGERVPATMADPGCKPWANSQDGREFYRIRMNEGAEFERAGGEMVDLTGHTCAVSAKRVRPSERYSGSVGVSMPVDGHLTFRRSERQEDGSWTLASEHKVTLDEAKAAQRSSTEAYKRKQAQSQERVPEQSEPKPSQAHTEGAHTVASVAKQARAKAEAAKQAKQPAQDAPKHKQQRKG